MESEEAFARLRTFEARHRSVAIAVYRGTLRQEGLLKLAIRCAQGMLEEETDPHNRAAVYRVLAQAHARLHHPDETVDNARNAVRLNPRSPWGWYWLAEGHRQSGCYASEASARKRELSLFTGSSDDEERARKQIYRQLGMLYRSRKGFRDPVKALCYFQKAGDYLNAIFVLGQDLHDLPGAQAVFEEARVADPAYFNQRIVQEDLRQLGLDVGDSP